MIKMHACIIDIDIIEILMVDFFHVVYDLFILS